MKDVNDLLVDIKFSVWGGIQKPGLSHIPPDILTPKSMSEITDTLYEYTTVNNIKDSIEDSLWNK
jgi:hypothetical protein